MEVESQKNGCKVLGLVPRLVVLSRIRADAIMQPKANLVNWEVFLSALVEMLLTDA